MMDELTKFAEALCAPIRVCVIDDEEEVGYQIEDALTVYNCDVQLRYDPEIGCKCLRTGQPCRVDLVFISDTVEHVVEVVKHIERERPSASIVVLTRNPSGSSVAELMRNGVYTFLAKNGSFNAKHVKMIFQQLNLRLHALVQAAPEVKVKSKSQPS
jgi:DNA-binding NtrC family response regulator